jgi:hypothetical protein
VLPPIISSRSMSFVVILCDPHSHDWPHAVLWCISSSLLQLFRYIMTYPMLIWFYPQLPWWFLACESILKGTWTPFAVVNPPFESCRIQFIQIRYRYIFSHIASQEKDIYIYKYIINQISFPKSNGKPSISPSKIDILGMPPFSDKPNWII